MKKIFLDTSAYSAFKRNHPKTIESIAQADQIFINAVVLGELLSGFDRGRFREANRKELKEFLFHPAVTPLTLSEETAERYALIHNDLRSQGTPIPTNDLWIAASVMESGSLLLTADLHFKKIRQIQTLFL